jgi:hypothetical protein
MRGLTPAAWTLFAAILIALGGQFLFACGFGLGGFFWNACPVPVDAAPLAMEAERGEYLQRQIHAVEMDIARKPVCEKPKPKEEFIRLQEKAYKRGAASGKLEVFLAWHTLDDVDLEIECPGGLISGVNGNFGPGICGSGKLDLDANRDLTVNIQRDPVEHIAWSDEPPAGEYRFRAHIYKAKDGARPSNIPFEMTISLDGEQKKCSGTLEWIPRSLNVKAPGGGILATRIASLRWKSGDPLPNCDWQFLDSAYCDAPNTCSKN